MAAEAPRAGPPAALRLYVGAGGREQAPGASAWLGAGAEFDLPEAAAAHVKVRRLQPGAAVRLFDGESGQDWPAAVRAIGRAAVRVRVGEAPRAAPADELPVAVSLAFGMPANDRVDDLVEKATELGVADLWPLMTERSVLRLHGERAERRRAHWHAVAAAACEQCGRARVPRVHPVQPMAAWLAEAGAADPDAARWLLSTDDGAPPLARAMGAGVAAWAPAGEAAAPGGSTRAAWPGASHGAGGRRACVVVLSGPEGGLSADEIEAAAAAGFAAVSLGPRILRADTAPLAVLAWLGIALAQRPGPKAGV